jgi:hypothetical protein
MAGAGWRANRVALAAAGLAMLAGTPAVLAAAKVKNPGSWPGPPPQPQSSSYSARGGSRGTSGRRSAAMSRTSACKTAAWC